MKVEVIGKHKALLDGHLVRLRQVKTMNDIKGGTFYIRSFNGDAVTTIKLNGQPCSAKSKYKLSFNKGKRCINSCIFSYYRGKMVNELYYLSDLGVRDSQHRNGAQLFEFDHNTHAVLKNVDRNDYNKLMGYGRFDGISLPDRKSVYR